MSMDRTSNMLSSLKNCALAKKPSIEVFHSNECEEIAKILKNRGFLSEVKVFKPKGKAYKMLRLDLAHEKNKYSITDVKRVSKPGRRIYRGAKGLSRYVSGHGVSVVSTSQGLMDTVSAMKKNLGGEVLCEVY